jgi:signal transduction histidine kinase
MSSARILIVEDEAIVARDLGDRLAALGYTVAGTTAFGEEAVRLAVEAEADLVLMDVRLRGAVDGVSAAEALRSRRDVPVVYLTAHADEATLARARVTEPFGYVLKPFEERELRTVIEMALYKHQAEAERKRLEERIRQAQKMEAVGQLAGGIAHDFNNLLTAINGYAYLLRDGLPADSPWHPAVEAIAAAGEHAADLTRQLLAFSRKRMVQPRLLDPNQLVRHCEQILHHLIQDTIQVCKDLDPAVAKVRADPGQLEQVLFNLAVNARDAMPQGGRLTLATAQVVRDADAARAHPEMPAGPYVRLTVADTGRGMDEATRARIFEPFFTTKEVGQGTGLGLTTVYGIVKASGGWIDVASTPGQGTTFTIHLPAVAEAAAAAPAPGPAPAQGAETLLLVEDDASVRGLSSTVLRQRGYTVLEAEHGVAALELLARYSGPLDLVVTDVVMPHMSGHTLAALLTRQRPGLRVLFVSGYAPSETGSVELPGTATAFLHKPFAPDTLAAQVRELLDRPVGPPP